MLCTKHGGDAKVGEQRRDNGMDHSIDSMVPQRLELVHDMVEAERQHGQWAV